MTNTNTPPLRISMTTASVLFVIFFGLGAFSTAFHFLPYPHRLIVTPEKVTPVKKELREPKTNPTTLLGTGIVKSIDRSDPILTDAGLKKITVLVTHNRGTTGEWQIIVPVSVVFVESDTVDLYSRSPDTYPVVAVRRPPINK